MHAGGLYHALNRDNLRAEISHIHVDFDAFDKTLHERLPSRVACFTIMRSASMRSARKSPGRLRFLHRIRQFSIRWLLLAMLVCALIFARFSPPLSQYWFERSVANAIVADGGSLEFTNTYPESRVDRWLHAFQPKVFDRIYSIDFRGTKLDLAKVRRIASLAHLTEVDCSGCDIDREHLFELRRVEKLARLSMKDNPRLNDDDLFVLRGHPNRLTIEFDGTNISLYAYRRFLEASGHRSVDNLLSLAAPKKMSKVEQAIARVQPLEKNSFYFQNCFTHLALFKHDPKECLLICRGLADSEMAFKISIVQNQLSEELMSGLKLLDVKAVLVYGTEYEAPKLFDLLSQLKQLETLACGGSSLPGRLDSLVRLKRLNKLCLLYRDAPFEEDLEILKSMTSLRVLVLRSSPVQCTEIRTMLPQLKQAFVRDQMPPYQDTSPNAKELWRLYQSTVPSFDASDNEVTGSLYR